MKSENPLPASHHHYVTSNKNTQRSLTNIPEFVKKLFSMLEENAYPAILSWGLDGKTFVVVEPNEFSKLILPKHFKHGNFSSFVRQLNKYDFHKIRHRKDDWPFGHQAWEFCHSHFQYKRKELLRGIKRKPTNHTPTKATPSSLASSKIKSTSSSLSFAPLLVPSPLPSPTIEKSREELRTLTDQINEIQRSHTALTRKLRSLAQNHQLVVETLSTFKKSMTVQDDYIQRIFQSQGSNFSTSEIHQTYQTASLQDQNKLELIINYVKEQQHQFSTLCMPDQGTMLEPPPPPILVPPTLLPMTGDSTTRWTTSPRILLAVSSINNGKVINDQLFQWLQSFGCTVNSILIDPLVDPFDVTAQFDLLFVDESILSRNLSVFSTMRQKNPWVPLICLCQVILDHLFIDWMKQGVTDVLARPLEQQSIFKMVGKYCSHLKSS